MNFIHSLQQRVATLEHREDAVKTVIREFRIHLDSPKFSGTDVDGSRKDWIAVGDVVRWLSSIESASSS